MHGLFAKAVPYVDTNYDYNNVWMSVGKAAVHCTPMQSLHCKTRNEVFKSFLLTSTYFEQRLESRYFIV